MRLLVPLLLSATALAQPAAPPSQAPARAARAAPGSLATGPKAPHGLPLIEATRGAPELKPEKGEGVHGRYEVRGKQLWVEVTGRWVHLREGRLVTKDGRLIEARDGKVTVTTLPKAP